MTYIVGRYPERGVSYGMWIVYPFALLAATFLALLVQQLFHGHEQYRVNLRLEADLRYWKRVSDMRLRDVRRLEGELLKYQRPPPLPDPGDVDLQDRKTLSFTRRKF